MLAAGKEAATLHNQFLSLFLSLFMTCEEELRSEPCTFSSSSWGRVGRERPKGKTLTKHSKTIPNCQKQRYSGHEADRDVWSLSRRDFVEMFWILCCGIWVKQASSYQREVFCPTQSIWLLAQFHSLHKNTLTQLLLKRKVLIFQYRDWQSYFNSVFVLPLFLFTLNLPKRFSMETCQETPGLS